MTASLRPTILYREKARYTEEARQNKIQGSVLLQVVFNINGLITGIKVIRGLPDGLTEKMNRFEGSTRIYDALDRAVTMLNRSAPRTRQGRPVRRVVVVITDGFDSASIIDRREVIRRANDAGVTIYSVTLPSFALSPTDSTTRVITPLDASRIIPATGGQDFLANAQDFTPIFKALAEEIRASYALAYYPENCDGKRHELRIKTSRAGIQIRASRTSYTAPAQ
jgi:Ca-activated chloride channel homolog